MSFIRLSPPAMPDSTLNLVSIHITNKVLLAGPRINQYKGDELTQLLPLRQNPEFPVVLAGHTLLDLELAVVGPVTLPRTFKTFTPPSDTSPRAAPTTPSRCSSTRGGWQLSGSASCEIITRSSNSTEVGRPLLYSIFEKAFLHHNERNQKNTERPKTTPVTHSFKTRLRNRKRSWRVLDTVRDPPIIASSAA